MSRLTLLFIIAVAAMICSVGQQPAFACVTPGYDEFILDGCADSACTFQDCTGIGGGHIYPTGGLTTQPSPRTTEFFLVAAHGPAAWSPDETALSTGTDVSKRNQHNLLASVSLSDRGIR